MDGGGGAVGTLQLFVNLPPNTLYRKAKSSIDVIKIYVANLAIGNTVADLRGV